MNEKQIAEEAAEQMQAQCSTRCDSLETKAAIIQAAIEKAVKLCNDRREELRHKLHEATDRINEYMAALQSRAAHANE